MGEHLSEHELAVDVHALAVEQVRRMQRLGGQAFPRRSGAQQRADRTRTAGAAESVVDRLLAGDE